MKLYSYIITRDFGFAPNPFPPCCTLATCKPMIRRKAEIGDWVVGIGSGAKGSQYKNKIIYAMKVNEKLTFDEYWLDSRFERKRPVMNGSKRQMYGDNIYHRPNVDSPFIQEDSHHSLANGQKNELNYNRDLPGEFVLLAKDFWYFGRDAISIPSDFLLLTKVARGYKISKDKEYIHKFSGWIHSLPESGYIGKPHMFNKEFMRYSGR